jgi:probable phosphoglycerate mutase
MTTFTLVRHGQTDWNLQKRIQGSTDIPLNDTGREQARATAESLADRHWDGIVASPLSRARETAQIIADRLDLGEPELVPALVERAYGDVEGMDAARLREAFPDSTAPVPGRERRSEVVRRAVPALETLAEEHPGQSLIVVTHGGVIGSLIRYITEKALPAQGHAIENGSAHEVRVEDGHLAIEHFNGVRIAPTIRSRAPLSIELTLPN